KKNDMGKMAKLGENVGATTRNLSGLLDNLLNWALQQTGKIPHHPQDLNLLELANQTEELFSANADAKGVALQTSIASDHHVFADRDGVQTILRNLVGNAIKFTSSGESVSVSSQPSGEFLEITVTDDGVGMDKNQLENLFSLDKRSKKGTAGESGTGVGLILCKELAELNGGSLRVENGKGVGTKVIFTLPLASKANVS
ncbi:MAG: HAMP domain-containing sensor histidine kinase, partial [Bacteroidota bacterium]